jgi:hypothetical protein
LIDESPSAHSTVVGSNRKSLPASRYRPTRSPSPADAALARLVDGKGADQGKNIRLAEVYAYRGMMEQAISALQDYRNAIDTDEETAYADIWWLQREMLLSPFLTPLQADPRWTELMAEPP